MHRALAHPTCWINPPVVPSDIHVGTVILQKSHANLSSKVQLSMDVKLHLHVPSRMNREQDVLTCVMVVSCICFFKWLNVKTRWPNSPRSWFNNMSGQLVFALSQVIRVIMRKTMVSFARQLVGLQFSPTEWADLQVIAESMINQEVPFLSALQLPCALSTVFPLQTFQPPWCLHSSTSSVHYWTLATSIPLLHKRDGPNSWPGK